MMTTPRMTSVLGPRARSHRPPLARLLRAVSRWIDHRVARLEAAHAAAVAARMGRVTDPRLEFHAEAGAPEGALYLDGELVARLPGVTRL